MLIPYFCESHFNDAIRNKFLMLYPEQRSHLLVDVVLSLDGGLTLFPVAYALTHQLARFAEVALRDEGSEIGFAVAFCYVAVAAALYGVWVVVGEGLALFARVEAEDASCVLGRGRLSESDGFLVVGGGGVVLPSSSVSVVGRTAHRRELQRARRRHTRRQGRLDTHPRRH